ncbi:ketoacyl-synt-domain-containing protein [Aspergillus violaceofuscus CBS 115571]|uniref:Ketoacyl-synt-domain-containing protein n=1 Tax=Aspergillus violaceofuscus (strain CBS 115571) TaxID=1450538 RepID=A0A2V5H5T0_ASPV1|nr:ketoacyl-synt-domain-containing protein [Aspergillus violaceofuscus CBS 115571]
MHKDIVDKLSHDDQSPATASTGQSQDVAVIGLACRLPGDNNSPEELWHFLANKYDACSEIPPARWEAYQRWDAASTRILANVTKRGYFVDGIANFDAAFFEISAKEAEQLDPQQRMSLEVAWEALEHAGIPPYSLVGSDTAVFMGVNTAGVLEDQLILSATSDSFGRVLAPKMGGSLVLHRLFPPGTLDLLILFSSCGHLFGFLGQGSYASGNSFLNSLATHRQSL